MDQSGRVLLRAACREANQIGAHKSVKELVAAIKDSSATPTEAAALDQVRRRHSGMY
jgi:hypothetical protein